MSAFLRIKSITLYTMAMKSTNITQTYKYNFTPISLISVRNSSAKRLDRNFTTGSKLKPTSKSNENGTII